MLDPADLTRALEVATAAVRAAEAPIMRGFRSPALLVERKRDGSVVSEADRAAEDLIRAHLHAEFPDIPVFGEEAGLDGPPDHPLRWVVDPIDGTISYVNGVPLFGTIVGLEDTRTAKTLVGVINLPCLGETYAAAEGLGCTCNGETVRVSLGRTDDSSPPERILETTLVSAGDRAWFTEMGEDEGHERLSQLPFFRGYADCFGHAMVLRGAVAVMVDPGLAPWDLAATRVLVPEAGGKLFTRPAAAEGKVDAILGREDLVDHLASTLGWG